MDTQTFEFVDRLNETTTIEDAWSAWTTFVRQFGASHTVYGYMPIERDFDTDSAIPFQSTMPQDWMNYYTAQNYIELDGTVAHCMKRVDTVKTSVDDDRWFDALSPEQKHFERQVADLGGRSALVVPLREKILGGWGGISYLTDLPRSEFLSLIGEIEIPMAVAAHAFQEQMQSLVRSDARGRVRLTTREYDCLRCIMDFMTVRQTADMLGIKPKTVYIHLDRVKAELGVDTYTQMVAKAMRYDLLLEL